ncbi:MAG: hypothetical protein IT392_06915 [Nitrospirae bacterium]|nr:hypothetical protein [Nitrospirota bacterium]
MILSIFIVLIAWLFALLNATHIMNSIDPVDSLLLAIAATIFALRYNIRYKNRRDKKKSLSLASLYIPKN